MDATRRTMLVAAGTTIGFGGCIGDLPGGSDDDGDKGKDNGDNGDVEFDVFQLGSTVEQSLWRMDEDATGFVTLLESDSDRLWMVDDPAEIEGLESWLEETDFDESRIVYLETVGPNTCYSEIDVSDVDVQEGTIVGAATAVDTSEENEVCGAAETHPSAFVRVTGENVPSAVAFTVTDGRGESSRVVADGRLVDPAALPGHVRSGGDPPKLEELSCDEADFERHWGPDEGVALGEVYDENDTVTFAMRVGASYSRDTDSDEETAPRMERGDRLRITMWNISDEVQYSGNRHKWNLQVRTMNGWQDVRGTTDGEPVAYTDEAVEHRPGRGFEWSLAMTEAGVIEGHEHEDRLQVCPRLPDGRYRFIHQEAGGKPLSVEFAYTE